MPPNAVFKAYGVAAIVAALTILVILLGSIVSKGYSAFVQTDLTLEVTIPAEAFPEDPDGAPRSRVPDYQSIVTDSFMALFPEVRGANRPAGGARHPERRRRLRTARARHGLIRR